MLFVEQSIQLGLDYYRRLRKNEEFFAKAYEIAKEIKKRAKEVFGDCDVFIVGSFAQGEHTLSSDLDLLIVSSKIPSRLKFEEYSKFVKLLTNDDRVNIHLLSKESFEEVKKFYEPRIEIS
ncbi:MAG: uncharacterized protein PWQ58_923 [Archaeoglobaceae archaeon]|nr:uncharacterized protein [Archaeoglobaceae archaeon]